MRRDDIIATLTLLTPEAVRQRCYEVLAAEANGSKYFHINNENLDAAVDLVEREIISNYPNGKVPFHSRWRHLNLEIKFLAETALKLTKGQKMKLLAAR